MTPSEALKARGILEQAQEAGWTEQEAYWRYPILNALSQIIAEREKRYPSVDTQEHKAKVRWHPSKPKDNNTQWYILPKGFAAIKETGVMYVCNGEPSVLAMHAGGIDNVGSTTLSEVAFPKEGIAYLKSIGANRIIYLADKDAAGTKSAMNWRDALVGSGIDFEAFVWPDLLADKADANDAWIAVNFEITTFQEMIAGLRVLDLPAPLPKPQKQAFTGEIDNRNLVSALRSALESGGYLERKIYQGVFQECHCPFHDDKESSAGFSIESGVLNCMGSCGRAYSPHEVAEFFGIQWRDFVPKQDNRKALDRLKQSVSHIHEVAKVEHRLDANGRDYWTGKKPRKKPEITVLDMSLETLVEMPAKPLFISTAWINQPELPISWIKAFLHLTHSKSITVLLAIELQRAIYKGLIDGANFTLKDILSVFRHPRKSTSFALEFLLSLNYVSILDTNLLEEESMTTKSTQKDSVIKKGRPETHYRLNTHTPSLAIALAERLEPVLLERLTEDLERAPRNHLLRDALDLDLADFKAWAERTNTPKHEYISNFIRERICDVLENTSYLEFSEKDLEHPSNLRGKLITLTLEPFSEALITLADGSQVLRERVGVQLSRAKMAWELGCSESSLTNLYQENHIGTKEIYAWHEVVNPNGADIRKEIREAPYNLNKDIGGVAYGGVLHYWDYGILQKTKLLPSHELIAEFEKRNNKIEKLYLQVQQPSLLWNMTHEEIAEKRANEAKKAEQELAAAETDSEVKKAYAKLEKAQGKAAPRKKSVVSGKDRLYTGLSPEFVRKEIEKEVSDFTKYALQGLVIVSEATGEIIHSVKALREVVLWLNDYAAKAKEAPKPATQPIVAPKPAPKPVVVQQAENYAGWCWANHPDEFEERMKAIGG